MNGEVIASGALHTHAPTMTHATLIEEKRALLRDAGLDEAAYENTWLSFQIGPLPVRYPMTKGIRVALPKHDLHHVLTGYAVDDIGECEIAAWELGSGCKIDPLVWYGNLAFMALGLFIAPKRTYRAFVRGCHSTNLYRRSDIEHVGSREARDVREELSLHLHEVIIRPYDVARFAWNAAAAIFAGASFLLATPLLVIASAIHKGVSR